MRFLTPWRKLVTIAALALGAASYNGAGLAQITEEEAVRQIQAELQGLVIGVTTSSDPPGFWVRVLHPDGRVEDRFVSE